MILDTRRDAPGHDVFADVAIVGAGAAGIVLALELSRAGLSVIIAEAGGDSFDKSSQEFYRAESIAPDEHSPIHMYRRRVLGGSTSVWGGRCIPFDPIDFEDRPWMRFARWPLTYADVARYYPRALEYASAGPLQFRSEEALPHDKHPLVSGVESDDVILNRLERFSQPKDFGRFYRKQLDVNPQIRLYTHCAVEQITTSDTGAAVSGVRVRFGNESVRQITARTVIIAAGGLETPRLLLASNEVRSKGLGNDLDNVGRFYQCHIEGEIGSIAFTGDARQIRQDYQRTREGVYVRRYVWLSPAAQRANELAGLILRPHHAPILDPAHGHPILSSMYLAKSMVVPEYARKMTSAESYATKGQDVSSFSFYAGHLRNIARGSPELMSFSYKWFTKRILAKRKLPSVVLPSKQQIYPVDINAEQEPNPNSRVTLGSSVDRIGMRRLIVDWKSTEADHIRLASGLRLIGRAFAASATVKLMLDDDQLENQARLKVPIGGHHIGTARMSDSPSEGVCDRNCQVFSCEGLFVAGSSVFSTSGFANPTLTIIALSLRLAEYLVDRRLAA